MILESHLGLIRMVIQASSDIPEEISKIDDELKAIYHSSDTVCIWVFWTRDGRNKFMNETLGMMKSDREKYYEMHYT